MSEWCRITPFHMAWVILLVRVALLGNGEVLPYRGSNLCQHLCPTSAQNTENEMEVCSVMLVCRCGAAEYKATNGRENCKLCSSCFSCFHRSRNIWEKSAFPLFALLELSIKVVYHYSGKLRCVRSFQMSSDKDIKRRWSKYRPIWFCMHCMWSSIPHLLEVLLFCSTQTRLTAVSSFKPFQWVSELIHKMN